MKKVYSAPDILFESFVMSTNIAGDCEILPTDWLQSNYNSCGHVYGDYIIFGTDLGGCNGSGDAYRQVNPDSGYFKDSYCYHVPSVESNIFNS